MRIEQLEYEVNKMKEERNYIFYFAIGFLVAFFWGPIWSFVKSVFGSLFNLIVFLFSLLGMYCCWVIEDQQQITSRIFGSAIALLVLIAIPFVIGDTIKHVRNKRKSKQ